MSYLRQGDAGLREKTGWGRRCLTQPFDFTAQLTALCNGAGVSYALKKAMRESGGVGPPEPYGYASGNSYHHSRQHTGRHVLHWPSEEKDRSRNQCQQSGWVACRPKIVVHFALHRLVVTHFYGEKAEIIVIFLTIFSGVFLRF